MHGLGVLRDLEDAVAAVIGERRMAELHRTLRLVIGTLSAEGLRPAASWKPPR
jgi:hypothetical protein